MQRVMQFLQARSAQRWIPLGLSVAIHGLLIAALVVTVQHYSTAPAHHDSAVKVPDAVLIEDAPVGGAVQPPTGQTPAPDISTHLVMQPAPPAGQSGSVGSNLAQSIIAGANQSGSSGSARSLLGGDPKVIQRIGAAETNGPMSHFMGISGDALRVVFVCDASGSMMDRMPRLIQQLQFSIAQLKPVQWFNVIFFQYDRAMAADPKGLIQALPQNRQRVEQMIQNVAPMGSSNPMNAIKLAFAQNAQVIYLLTDGDFQDPGDSITDEKIIQQIHRLNPVGQVHVNTILFISNAQELQSDDAQGGRNVLETIAKQNGGTFKVVFAEER